MIKVFLIILNFLVLLGYVMIYPIEKLITYLRKNSKKMEQFLTRPITITFFKEFSLRKVRNIRSDVRSFFALMEVQKKKNRSKSNRLKQKKSVNKRKDTKPRFYFAKLFFMFFFGSIFSLVFIALPVYGLIFYKQLPNPELLQEQTQTRTTKILDRSGRVLYEIYIDKRYDPVPLTQVPDDVINATLAIEDAAFYTHPGFDIHGIARAARSTFLENELQGGSTITQQLIKNVLLTPDRTYTRKAKELVLAVMVEQKYTKSQILEFYLNNIPYGGTSYGIQSASQRFFNKNVWELDLAEASMLAGLPSAPSVYSPLQGDLNIAKQRQKQVLNRMVELGYITVFEAEVAYDKKLEFAPQVEYIRAPHFVNYVREELYKKYGQRAVDFGGLTVVTTLDLDLQEKVQRVVTEEVQANGAALNFSNGAALVLDSRTGEVLAYVGSVDFFNADGGKFDVVTAYRQPGSSIKPITYALALEKGQNPLTIIEDSPITYQFNGQKYTPKNYDNRYHGKVTLRQALANSYNIPAVKLVNTVGVDDMVQLGVRMGLKNWVVGDGTYGMAVTLGGKEVRLLDLTNLYATFSRAGKYREVTPFLSVKDIYGYEILSLADKGESQPISSETAYIISHILSDNNARVSAFGPNSKLHIPGRTIAVKTGTTNDIRDNLTIGYTPSYTVGVWVGNNDNTPMNNKLASGLTGAAPIWNRVMLTLLEDKENEEFAVPPNIVVKEDSKCPNKLEVFNKNFEIPDTICVTKSNDKKTDGRNQNRR